ncbi:MAG: endonuclease [Thiothrix sp.]|nr:endonuclease [Thiothrix sp.]HPQ95960.1 endonuclease [Thiolinea sp.]
MKFATFNLFQFVAPGYYWYERHPRCTYTEAEWHQKQGWIRKRLTDMDADVVGFQEVFSIPELKTLCREAGYPHVAVVGTPQTRPDDTQVFSASVVALASRHSLEQVGTVEPDPDVMATLHPGTDFTFSRSPVCADVRFPDNTRITVLVVHLKSKRPATEDRVYADTTPWPERVRDTLKRLSRGNVAAMLQRGTEATLLYHHACRLWARAQAWPVVILGDMNDAPDSPALAALTMQERIPQIGGMDAEHWPDGVKHHLHDHRLSDSFRIAPNMRQRVRPFTHIHRGRGDCIDHVLVSNALNPLNPEALAEVAHYQVWNQHLEQDGTDNRLQSDHGQVCIDIIPTTRPGRHAPNPAIRSPQDVLTRQDFVDLAGGVFQSHKHFRQWGSQDKWEQFWSFFFDTSHGWVTSVYGSTPVDELYQKQKHSIEHVIPRDFLDRYLTRRRYPRQVRYGASTNPLNFAPSERGLNARRSNFPFDLDGDRVIRPRHMKLDPESHSSGLDADNEWVIPSRNRGDIARAILYMLLVYEIDELYNRHIDTLVHWAKIDTPSAWEIAYNNWVHTLLGIRNPLIDEPGKALILLDNSELIQSIRVRDQT